MSNSLGDPLSDRKLDTLRLKLGYFKAREDDHIVTYPLEPRTIMQPLGPATRFDLGKLSRLPEEILVMVVLMLDVYSVLNLSQASRSFRCLLYSIPEFRRLGQHAATSCRC